MCKCAEGFECDSDQSRAIATLKQKLKESNELLNSYRELAMIDLRTIAAQNTKIKQLSDFVQQIKRNRPFNKCSSVASGGSTCSRRLS